MKLFIYYKKTISQFVAKYISTIDYKFFEKFRIIQGKN